MTNNENDGVAENVNPYSNATQAVSGTPAAATMTEQRAMQMRVYMMQIVRSANWFYWIAGLSIVNLFAALLGANFRFVIGLGFSEVLTGLADEATKSGHSWLPMYIGCVLVTGFFAACGWLTRRPSLIALIVGMVVFALDTLIFVMGSDWIGVAFHGWALYQLGRGIPAVQVFKKLAK